MSKALKTVAIIAGGVALVATGLGAVGAISAKLAGSISTYASLTATAASIGAQVTTPKPVARGSITQTIIASEPPRPYMIGESYSAGVMRYQVGYGGRLKKVDNPYLWQVMVYSGVGPVEALVSRQFDFSAIGSYYNGFYNTDTQLGVRPEATALVPPYGAATGWGAASKLSGCAAIGWNFKFDKDGKVFSSGLPVVGAIWKGELCYDPRLDDTQPGGVGSHRLGTESTYTYSTNPALHAGTYAYGRYEGTKKVFGIGMDSDAIDWAAIALWANDCEANSWECHGTIFEGGDQTGSRVKNQNLTDICAAGGGRWFMAGAVLTFDWHRPRVSLATFTDADIVGAGVDLVALQTHRDRFNAVRPKYISPSHNWQQITAEKIVGTTYVTEDGQEKPQAWPLNLVKHDTQAGQLATYAMADSREIGPVTVPLGVDWSFYRPGDTLTWDSDILEESRQFVVVQRNPDPVKLETTFVFKSETPAKHPYALGQTATAPATPIIGQTGEERDQVAGYLSDPRGAFTVVQFTPGTPITPGDGQVAIVANDALLDDGRTISLPADTITGLTQLAGYRLLWDFVTEDYVVISGTGATERESSRYIDLGGFYTSDGTTFPAPPAAPEGYYPPNNSNYQEP